MIKVVSKIYMCNLFLYETIVCLARKRKCRNITITRVSILHQKGTKKLTILNRQSQDYYSHQCLAMSFCAVMQPRVTPPKQDLYQKPDYMQSHRCMFTHFKALMNFYCVYNMHTAPLHFLHVYSHKCHSTLLVNDM